MSSSVSCVYINIRVPSHSGNQENLKIRFHFSRLGKLRELGENSKNQEKLREKVFAIWQVCVLCNVP